MSLRLVALAALGAACAGCSAPAVPTTLAADNPANPAALSVPFVRPVNVLADGGAPSIGIPSTAMHMSGGSMASMGMPGGSTAGTGSDMPGMPGMRMAQATPKAPSATGQAAAVGTVNTVDPAKHSVNLTHLPIKGLGWPSMTMDFPVASSVELAAIKPGQKVNFTLGAPDPDGNRRIEQLKPVAGQAGGTMPGMDQESMAGMKIPGNPQ